MSRCEILNGEMWMMIHLTEGHWVELEMTCNGQLDGKKSSQISFSVSLLPLVHGGEQVETEGRKHT